MKLRNGFISNSSATSFIITNKTDEVLSIKDFLEENLFLVDDFNKEYSHNYTKKEALASTMHYKDIDLFPGETEAIFGDEHGTVVGAIFDYILREGGDSKRFSWRFHEYHR